VAIRIKHNGLEIHAGLTKLSRDQRTAIQRALNRVSTTVRAEATKEVRQTYSKIKASDFKKQIKIRKANRSNLDAELSARTKRIPLGFFKVTQLAKGVRAILGKGKKVFIPGGFLAAIVPTRGEEPTKRKGKKRIPTYQLLGPAVSQLLSAVFVRRRITETIRRRLPIEYESALKSLGNKNKIG